MKTQAVAFLAAGVIMLIIALCMWLKNLSFNKSAVTDAVVEETKTGSVHMNGRRVTTYGLTVGYSIEGTDYKTELPCNKTEYEKGASRTVQIRY